MEGLWRTLELSGHILLAMKRLIVFSVFMFLMPVFASSASAQSNSLKIEAKLTGKAAVGQNSLQIKLSDSKGVPVDGAKVSISVNMATMDMGTTHPVATSKSKGVYEAKIQFGMAGSWKVTIKAEAKGFVGATKSFEFNTGGQEPMHGEHMHGEQMEMGSMMGRLGSWGMQRESSGTSWVPDDSPMFMKMLPKSGKYDLSLMGFGTLAESDAGGKHGDNRFFSTSMIMVMARRETGPGTLGLNFMASLDPVFNGEYGYPNLFQTGETAYGIKLTDYQHPHDLISEFAGSYSTPTGKGTRAFIYGGPVGEPALGGPTTMHRPSGMEIPEAPIGHHWFDSTHIAWGVVTLGVNSDKWQVEGSAFNGHEPDENRYSPDPVALNSASGRITYNPSKNWSFNSSYGFLKDPESTDPGVHQHRLTAAAIYSKGNLAAAATFGRNIKERNTDAFLAEATYFRDRDSLFARWENVQKDELGGVPEGTYTINKFLLGGIRDFARRDGFDLGVGAYAGFYIFPRSLEPFYGKSPATVGVFLQLRPSKMEHAH